MLLVSALYPIELVLGPINLFLSVQLVLGTNHGRDNR